MGLEIIFGLVGGVLTLLGVKAPSWWRGLPLLTPTSPAPAAPSTAPVVKVQGIDPDILELARKLQQVRDAAKAAASTEGLKPLLQQLLSQPAA